METVVFTSANTCLMANDISLGFVQSIVIEDVVVDGEKYSDITLHRYVNDCEYVINEMRSGPFTFSVANQVWNPNEKTGPRIGGYYSPEAEVVSFKMNLFAKNDMLLEQFIVIRAKSFKYVADVRVMPTKVTETEDFKNLIEILKKNQTKHTAKDTSEEWKQFKPVFRVDDSASIGVSDEDIVWANVKNPEQVKDVVKPRKLKKNKK